MNTFRFQQLDHLNCLLDTDNLELYGGKEQHILYAIWHRLPTREGLEREHIEKTRKLAYSTYRAILVDMTTLQIGPNNDLHRWLAAYLPEMIRNGLLCMAYVRPSNQLAAFLIQQEELQHSHLLPIEGFAARREAEQWVRGYLNW